MSDPLGQVEELVLAVSIAFGIAVAAMATLTEGHGLFGKAKDDADDNWAVSCGVAVGMFLMALAVILFLGIQTYLGRL